MGKDTGIAWTDHTFNAWWGCTKVSPACDFCYAEALSKQYGHDIWGSTASRRFFGDKHWNEPLRWDREAAAAGVKRRVFLNSMSDFLEGRSDLDVARARTIALIAQTPNLIWLMLTKRPQLARGLLPSEWFENVGGWPRNVWFGFTAENQERYDERLIHALDCPAQVIWVSAEPLLGPIRITHARSPQWIIVGGESGAHRRPFDQKWADDIRSQCFRTGTAFFMKQDSAYRSGERGTIPDSLWIREFPLL